MATSLIHCDFLEIYGPNWATLTIEQTDRMLRLIQTMDLIGTAPELRGFVGIKRIENIAGGFFTIQYEDERLYYDRTKHAELKRDAPFERVFFVFFANKGKLLLQNRTFANLPLKMPRVERLFREAINEVFRQCGVGFTSGFFPPEQLTADERFVEEFSRSTRVIDLVVSDPDPNRISEEFVYYNPQRDRNSIVRDSHQHDYSNFKKIDLEATRDGDIKSTHIGKDLIRISSPIFMRYLIGDVEYILRRELQSKFHFNIDMKALEVAADQLQTVIYSLRKETALNLDIPTPPVRKDSVQKSFLEILSEEHDANDEK